MKKTYNVPKVTITEIQLVHMFATSLDKHDSGSDGSVLTKEDNGWWGDED